MPRSRRIRNPRRRPENTTCGALVVIDSVRVRKKALTNCRRARTTFETAERELNRFETDILPAYERWRRDTFGPRLQELGELEQRIRELDTKLDMLDLIMCRTGCGPREAMDLLWEGMDREEPDLEDEDPQTFRDEMDAWMTELEEALADALEKNRKQIAAALGHGVPRERLLSQFLQTFAREAGLAEEDCLMFFPREEVRRLLKEAGLLEAPVGKKREPESDTRIRIKKLVRELAFALHPDQCGEHDDEKLDLWHRVQEAAAGEDLDELEVLHAHMQLLTGDVGPSVSVARLLDLTQLFRQSRAAIRRQLTRHRESPAWRFHESDERSRARIRRDQERMIREEARLRQVQLRNLERVWREMERGYGARES